MILNGVSSLTKQEAKEVAELAQTPAFVFNHDIFVQRLTLFKNTANTTLNNIKWNAVYAAKAFLSKDIAKTVAENGFGIDCCSETEMLTVLESGVSGQLIGLHGNNKSVAEIEMAIKQQIARLVVDSLDEIDMIEQILQKHVEQDKFETPPRVMVRVTTGIHAGGHEYISTAHEDQKFGLQFDDATSAIEKLLEMQKRGLVILIGIHTHIGSQITSVDAFKESAKKMLEFRTLINAKTGFLLSEIDLGGGFAVQYTPQDAEFDLENMFTSVGHIVNEHCAKKQEKKPSLSFEPGRWLVAPTMQTLYSVGTIKSVPIGKSENRKYVSVDGGMSDNIRPLLYSAPYSAICVSRDSDEPTSPARIVGKHCESGDILVDNCELPTNIARGDLIAIQTTGAYGFSMASNYNMSLKPPVVKIQNGKSSIMIERQDPKALIF